MTFFLLKKNYEKKRSRAERRERHRFCKIGGVGGDRPKSTETFGTWAVGHRVKVAVGQHEVLRAALGLQPHGDVGDPVVEAGEAPQEVNGEGPGGPLDVNRQLVGPGRRLRTDAFDLLQQVAHRQDLVLEAADGPRPHAGDLLQVMSEEVLVQLDSELFYSLRP